MEYLNSYLKDNDYTFISKDVKGRYQGVVVSHIDEYAIPKLVYGVLYVQDHFNLGVDWNERGEFVPNYGGTTETHQTKYGPTE